MEILALLLLGLIAMLAIVPPIIRGKLEGSPLATTQSFQRSMQEMANSLEPYGHQEERIYGGKRRGTAAGPFKTVGGGRSRPAPSRASRRNRAAVRRSRILAILSIFASMWGVATLVSGKAWCLVVFAIASCLLILYWAMVLIVPHIASPSRAGQRPEETSRPPRRQAM